MDEKFARARGLVIERGQIRSIQHLIVLLSCLPRDGKLREVLERALALDEGPQMARLTPPDDLETNEGVLRWLELFWGSENLSPEEQELVWWQNDGQRMDAAIRELKAVEAKLGTTWTVAPAVPSPAGVSGADTPRLEDTADTAVETGFHHASAAQAIVELIEDGDGGDLLIEPAHQALHYRRRTRVGRVTRVVQAMSVGDSCSVISSDLWGAVRRWSRLEAPGATYVLHADGRLYPTAVVAVADRLRRFSEGCATPDDVHVAKLVGVPPYGRVLRHVRLRCGAGPGSAVRADVRWRLQRLVEHGSRSGRNDAGEVTDRLLLWCAAIPASGEVVTREEAARMAGVDLAGLDGAGGWDPELARRYRQGLAAGVAEPEATPVAVDVRHAVVGGLQVAIRRQVEAVSGRWLSAAGARQLLASPSLILRLEGAGESALAGEAAAPGTLLAEELRAAQARNPSMRVVDGAAVATNT